MDFTAYGFIDAGNSSGTQVKGNEIFQTGNQTSTQLVGISPHSTTGITA
jgi:hypothetical protein